VSKLGGRAAVISRVGAGAFGTFLKAELEQAGVHTDDLILDPAAHTSVVFVSRTRGTPDFEAFRDADYRLEPDDVREAAISRTKILHASTFALSRRPCRDAVRRAFKIGRNQGKIISLDPNYSPVIWPDREEARRVLPELLAISTITKPSLDDAVRLWGAGQSPESYVRIFHDLGPRVVVLTMGRDGILLSENGKLKHIPQRPIQVADATGAGDAFWAGFLTAMLDGESLYRCGLFAREVVERKLRTVGPLPGKMDRAALYAALDGREEVS
jgi:sugar/nucleoside kinase (ribokinase family)